MIYKQFLDRVQVSGRLCFFSLCAVLAHSCIQRPIAWFVLDSQCMRLIRSNVTVPLLPNWLYGTSSGFVPFRYSFQSYVCLCNHSADIRIFPSALTMPDMSEYTRQRRVGTASVGKFPSDFHSSLGRGRRHCVLYRPSCAFLVGFQRNKIVSSASRRCLWW